MERLTVRSFDGSAHAKQVGYYQIIDKLAEYEDAEEQGLLLRLPYNLETCGVVYYVDEKDSEIYRLTADKIEISRKFIFTIDDYDFFLEDFGKIVFTTKEEAEQTLERMEKENGD